MIAHHLITAQVLSVHVSIDKVTVGSDQVIQ